MDYFPSSSFFDDEIERAVQSIEDRTTKMDPKLFESIVGSMCELESNVAVKVTLPSDYVIPTGSEFITLKPYIACGSIEDRTAKDPKLLCELESNGAVESTVPSWDVIPTVSVSNLKPYIAFGNVQISPAITAQKIPTVGAKKRGRPRKNAQKDVSVIVPTEASGSNLRPSIACGNIQTSPAITAQKIPTVGAKKRGRPRKNPKTDVPIILRTEASGSNLRPSIACGNIQTSPAITAQKIPTVGAKKRGADFVSKWRGELLLSNSTRAQLIKKRILELKKRAHENANLEKTKIETAENVPVNEQSHTKEVSATFSPILMTNEDIK